MTLKKGITGFHLVYKLKPFATYFDYAQHDHSRGCTRNVGKRRQNMKRKGLLDNDLTLKRNHSFNH